MNSRTESELREEGEEKKALPPPFSKPNKQAEREGTPFLLRLVRLYDRWHRE